MNLHYWIKLDLRSFLIFGLGSLIGVAAELYIVFWEKRIKLICVNFRLIWWNQINF